MKLLKEKLILKKEELKILLENGNFNHFLQIINDICNKEMMEPSDYDLYSNVCPYDTEVSKFYDIEYVNASFVQTNGDQYIACQDPKIKYIKRFLSMLERSNFQCIISLSIESKYPKLMKLKEAKIIKFNNEPFISDEVYDLNGKIIRRIVCLKWEDFSVICLKSLEFLFEYLQAFDEKLKIIHCKAGVGRTGTFIMYRALKKYKAVDLDIFLDIFIAIRSQRAQMVTTPEQLSYLFKIFIKNNKSQIFNQ